MGNNPISGVDPNGGFSGPGPGFYTSLKALSARITEGIAVQALDGFTVLSDVAVKSGGLSAWGRIGLQATSTALSISRSLSSMKDVGAPSTAESFIPVWGSGREAIHDFQTGHPYWGTFNAAMAISDVFLVKGLVTGVGRVATKTAWKTGSNTWNATRKWIGKNGLAEARQEVHHWALHRNQGIGKRAPDWLKNQPWNLMNMPNLPFHDALHGGGPNPFNTLEIIYHGTPQWFKAVLGSGGGRIVEGVSR